VIGRTKPKQDADFADVTRINAEQEGELSSALSDSSLFRVISDYSFFRVIRVPSAESASGFGFAGSWQL